MKNKITVILFCMLALAANANDYVGYVNTMVGTASSETKASGMFGKGSEEFGQTLPAVLSPYGMNFWTPQTRDTEHKCVAPYYYADSLLQGFRNSHWIVGGCTQDYGSATIMPLFGTLRCQPEARASRFSHQDEISTPYYYSINLPDEGINAEMTGTSRAAIFRFTYSKSGKAYFVLNPNSDEGQGSVCINPGSCQVDITNPVHRIYQGKGQKAGFAGYTVAIFDREPAEYGTFQGESVNASATQVSDMPEIGAFVAFDVEAGETIELKVASSFTSMQGALANMKAEMPSWNFDRVRDNLRDTWNRHLGTIEAQSNDTVALRKFYTALYHASFLPHEVSDVDGKHPAFGAGEEGAKIVTSSRPYYDDFSAWDTYRAQHPLITLMSPARSADMMQSLVDKYMQGGWMPIFPCWNSYTAAMIGDHCAAIIADAYVKGVRNFDVTKAYEGLRKNAFEIAPTSEYIDGKGRRALESYLRYGYIPLEDSVPDAYHKKEQTSRTLEYAFDDYCLAQLAKTMLHKANLPRKKQKSLKADYDELMHRSSNYSKVINRATGYADGRYANGKFAFDHPVKFTKHITEGAPCHYTWYVPHNPDGLIKIMGGKKAFEQKLDSMFSERRYWHGNEPCHQIAYMYNCIGRRDKAAKEVRHIMDTEYLDCPGGLSGNDDAGQMSAWYVFSAIGFYPLCPASGTYALVAPTFSRLTLHLPKGKTAKFEVVRPAGSDSYEIVAIERDGKRYNKNFISHTDLLRGGKWTFFTK